MTEEVPDMGKSSTKESNAAKQREAAAAVKDEMPERETYTAKQVATRCGTDPKTMRKFFRSKASTVEPVGQGGRYEFDGDDLPQIKAEFEAWTKGTKAGPAAGKGPKSQSKPKPKAAAPAVVEVEEDDEELDDLEGPGEDELDDEGIDVDDLDLEFDDEDDEE